MKQRSWETAHSKEWYYCCAGSPTEPAKAPEWKSYAMDTRSDTRMALPSVNETVKSREQRYRCLESMMGCARAMRWGCHSRDIV